MSKSQTLFPNKVATVVVHPTPGVGDATTIAEGIALLPAPGGEVLLREGTYTPSATATLPVGKPVVVRGCGTDTVINLGANAICAFTIPDGQTVNTPVVFENFKVIGTEVANQGVVAYNDGQGLAEVYLTRVDTNGVEVFVMVNDGSFGGSSPGQDDVRLHLTECRIRPNTTDASVIIKNTFGGFNNVRTWMREVEFIGDSMLAVPLGRSDPLWGGIVDDNYFGDLYAENCEFSVGGTVEAQYGTILAVNCQIRNNDSTTPCVGGFTNGSNIGYGGSTFKGCTLMAVSFQHFDIVSYTSCTLDAWHAVTWEPAVWQGCTFMNSYGSPYPFNTPGDDPYIIEAFGTGTLIMGCVWANFDAVPTGIVNGIQASMIEIFAETTIIGNDFDDADPPAVVGIIEVFSGNCCFIGNRFPFAPTSGPPMKDWNGSNYYSANSQLFWRASGPITEPAGDGFAAGKGLGNTINGIRSWNGTGTVGGTATNNIIVDYRNNMGLVMTKGYFQNTGANNITVREQYITQDQGTFTRTTVIAATGKLNLDPFDFTGLDGAIDFQVVRYVVDVSGTTISWRVNFAAPGGVYQS